MRYLYSFLWWFALPFVLLRIWWRGRREPGYRQHIPERLGFYPVVPAVAQRLWIHAVSVGETRAAEPLVRALMAAFPDSQILLFKTPTCPNCKAAMALLDRAGVAYTAVNATEARELTEKYGVKQAPTLVIRNGEGFEKYRGVSDIRGWLAHKTA